MKENWKKYLAECIGTAVLTFAACGVAVVAGQIVEGQLGWWVATSLAFGLVIVAMAYSIGNISGCHINPAVSLAMLIRKKITLKDFCFYVIAQVVGALVGSLFLALCLRGDFSSLGGNEIQDLLKVTVDGELKTKDARADVSTWSFTVVAVDSSSLGYKAGATFRLRIGDEVLEAGTDYSPNVTSGSLTDVSLTKSGAEKVRKANGGLILDWVSAPSSYTFETGQTLTGISVTDDGLYEVNIKSTGGGGGGCQADASDRRRQILCAGEGRAYLLCQSLF